MAAEKFRDSIIQVGLLESVESSPAGMQGTRPVCEGVDHTV